MIDRRYPQTNFSGFLYTRTQILRETMARKLPQTVVAGPRASGGNCSLIL